MNEQRSIVTVTINPAVDLTTRVDVVTPERKLRCVDARREPGGGGINVSRAIRRMDGASTAIHTAGGPTGAMLGGLLDDEEVDRRAVESEGWTRENVIVDETGTDRQYRFCLPGPALREREWRAVLEAVEEFEPVPAYFVASGSLPPGAPVEFYARLAAVGARTGARFVLDTSGEPLRRGSEAGVFLLKPNVRELGDLVGRAIEGEEDQEKAVTWLVAEGRAEIVVLSLGAAGAVVATREGLERVRSPAVPIASRVGAGDSMVAGIVLTLARGETVREAVLHGVAAGAAAVTTPGTELCRGADVCRIHEAMKRAVAQRQDGARGDPRGLAGGGVEPAGYLDL